MPEADTTQLERDQGAADDQLAEILDELAAGRDIIDWLNDDCLEVTPIYRGSEATHPAAIEVLYTFGGPNIHITFTDGWAEIERHWGGDSDSAELPDPAGVFGYLSELYPR